MRAEQENAIAQDDAGNDAARHDENKNAQEATVDAQQSSVS